MPSHVLPLMQNGLVGNVSVNIVNLYKQQQKKQQKIHAVSLCFVDSVM